nr:MAG TPA: hypothetical protein [Caudoviricetes sp.]
MVSINPLGYMLVERCPIQTFAADYYLLITLSTSIRCFYFSICHPITFFRLSTTFTPNYISCLRCSVIGFVNFQHKETFDTLFPV